MAKSNWFEIRKRGELMVRGTTWNAKSAQQAMQRVTRNNEIECLVISHEDGTRGSDWSLESPNGFSMYPANAWRINPNDSDPQKRLELAKKCEVEFQSGEEQPNSKYSDFDRQLEDCKKELEADRIDSIRIDKLHRKEAIVAASKCMNECVLAESATIRGEKGNAGTAMFHADSHWQEAKRLAEMSRTPGATKPNTAEKAATNAKQQFDKTATKNREFRNKGISTKQAESLEIG